jgi:MoaA/NifB/PqqE/SkfB family radical SAM enzyme
MLKVLTIDINNTCEYSCLHCFHQKTKARRKRIGSKEFGDIVAPLKKLGLSDVFLSGGEPLLHPELQSILEISLKTRLFVSILTSALENSARQVELLANYPNLTQIRVSVESLQPELLSYIRGKDNAYRNLLNFIERLKEKRIFFGISTTVSDLNLDEVGEIFSFAVRNGAGYLRISPLVDVNEQENLHLAERVVVLIAEILVKRLHYLRTNVIANETNPTGYSWLFDLTCPGFSHTAYLFKEKGRLWLAPCPYAAELRVTVKDADVESAFEKLQQIALKQNPSKQCFLFRNLEVSPARYLFETLLKLSFEKKDDWRYQILIGNIINRQLEIFNIGYFPCWRSSPLMLFPVQNLAMV